MTESAGSNRETFHEKDRVRRLNGVGCNGTVLSVRVELVSPSAPQDRDLLPMVKVIWDNGTLSVLSPESLARV